MAKKIICPNCGVALSKHDSRDVLAIVERAGGACSMHDLSRATQEMGHRRRREAVDELVLNGVVRLVTEASGGRPRTVVSLIARDEVGSTTS